MIGGFLHNRTNRVQIIVIIAVFAALLVGQQAAQQDQGAIEALGVDAVRVIALVIGTVLLFWSLTRIGAKMLLQRLGRGGWSRPGALRLPSKFSFVSNVLMLGVFVAQLRYIGWANLVCAQWRLGDFVLLDEVLLVGPFVMLQLLKWHSFYPVNRYIKEYVVAGQLAEGIATRPVWSVGEYMAFHVRHGLLIVLAPLSLIFGFRDVVALLVERWFRQSAHASVIMESSTALGAMIIFVLSPLLLRRVWVTRPLPDGPLRQRLGRFCRRLRLRHRDILLWDTYGSVANAAVMGVLAPVRYVLLSDSLIENMPDDHIEAVFGHEAGHVRHHHILFMVLFVFGAGSLGILLIDLATRGLNGMVTDGRFAVEYTRWMRSGISVVVLIGWALLFGFVSRRFERQADVYGACACGAGDDQPAASTSADNKLPQIGAEAMVGALERIALLNGVSMQSRSWRHSSIAARCAFLRGLATSAGDLRRFGRTVIIIKIGIVLSLAAGTGWWWWLSRIGG